MEECYKDGLTRSIGLSNFNEQQLQRVYDSAAVKPMNLQIECHAYWPQNEIHELCKRLNITLTAYGPIGSPNLRHWIENMRFALFSDLWL